MPTEADGELWSPDGKYILFKSDVYPECVGTAAEESACNAKKVEEVKESKIKALIFTHLLYRHWNAYKEGKRTHLFVASAEGTGQNRTAGSSTAPDHSRANDRAPVGMTASQGSTDNTIERMARDVTPGDYDAPVFSMGGQDDYAFSPDGKELCYASNHDAMPAASTNNDLFTVPVDWPADATSAQVIAATKDITAENKAADNTPLYSPDGKYIAYRSQQRPGYESDRFRLMLYDRKTGQKVSLTEGLDLWVGTFVWKWQKAGSFIGVSGIYFVAEENGKASIRYTGLQPGPTPAIVSSGAGTMIDAAVLPNGQHTQPKVRSVPGPWGYVDDLALAPTSDLLFFTCMSLHAPNEICVVRPFSAAYGQERRFVTHINDQVLSQVSMSPLEPFWFDGAPGNPELVEVKTSPNCQPRDDMGCPIIGGKVADDKVEGFLVKPPNFDPTKKYPVKFLIHGGPESAWGDDWSYRWNAELFASPTPATPSGYVVIMINFHGSTGYGQKFIDAINGDWGGAPFEDLMKGLDYAEQHYPFIDKDRECALGASYGGWMANWILGHTNRFKCIVSHDGQFNTESAYGDTEELWFPEWEFKGTPWTNREMYRKWSPHLFAANFKTPTLVIHGQLDYRLDVSQGFDLFTTLQRQGVPSKMLYFPDEGHWVLKPQNSQLWYKTVNDWVDQWTKPVVNNRAFTAPAPKPAHVSSQDARQLPLVPKRN